MTAKSDSNTEMPSAAGAATRDDRIAYVGFAAWLVAGLILAFVVWKASLGTQIISATVWFLSVIFFAPKAVANLFGPVFLYETVRVGRRRLTFIVRTIYLMILTFCLGIVFFNWLDSINASLFGFGGGGGIRPGQMAKYGEMAFLTFAPLQYFVVVLLTPAYVAGIIADEKERKTLEFLFATDLRNREIIFGKLAARLVTLMMYIIAGLPLLASLMLFGGIDPEMLLGIYAGTILTMITLAAVSIFFSTIFKRPRDAIVMTYLMVGAYYIGTGFLSGILHSLPMMLSGPVIFFGYDIPVQDIAAWVGAANPIYLLIMSGLGGVPVEALAFRFTVTCLVITGYCLFSSIRKLRIIALNQSYGVRSAPKKEKTVTPRVACGSDPIFWREVHVEGGRKKSCAQFLAMAVVLILVYAWPILIFCVNYLDSQYRFIGWNDRSFKNFQEGVEVWNRIVTGGLSFLAMLAAATRAASVITSEKDRDTWITLISTPLEAWNIVKGKWWGAMLSVRQLLYLIFSVWIFSLVFQSMNFFMVIPSLMYLLTFIAFFAWLGVFISCTARTTLIASIRVMLIGLFLAGGFWIATVFCCFMPLSMMRPSGQTMEMISQFFLSMTPPFVMGWLPLRTFDMMEPFDPNRRSEIGPWFIILFFFVWNAASLFLALLSYQSIQRQTNRDHAMIEPPKRNLKPDY